MENIPATITPKQLLQNAKRDCKKFGILLFISLAFLSAGSLLFIYIEHCYDVTPVPLTAVEEAYIQLCKKLNTVTNDSNLNNTEIHVQMKDICHLTTVKHEQVECVISIDTWSKWLKYCMSIMFTIGYGVIVVKSDVGKIVTMIYAIPAISLAVATYVPIARALADVTKALFLIIELKLLKFRVIKHQELKIYLSHASLSIVFIACLAAFYTRDDTENLNYLNAFYFSFSTLTTIGFGDYEFKVKNYILRPYLFVGAGIFFYLGLGVFAATISSLLVVIEKYAPKLKRIRSKRKKVTITGKENAAIDDNDTTQM